VTRGPEWSGTFERSRHGKENYRLPEASGCRPVGDPVAPDRPRARSARPQHHGILQGVQRATQELEKGTPIPVVITIYADKSFTFETKTPAGDLLPQEGGGLKIGKSGFGKLPGKDVAGTITKAQMREIAEKKMKDLNAYDVEAAMKMIAGSARSMGLQVEG
jgi:ribosomal protein L11